MTANSAPQPASVLLSQALAYALHGWAVLPLHAIDQDGRCTCGKPACDSPGKHPRTPNGLKDASKTPAHIREWWRRWPAANVGIATGAISGLCVIDVDIHQANGFETLRGLVERLGELPACPAVSTGSGGQHLYLALDGAVVRNSSGQLGPGVDVRGEGGYVVAPPSVHETLAHYQWLPGRSPRDVAAPPLPAAWRAEMAERRPRGQSVDIRATDAAEPADGLPGGAGRNVTLASLAGTMRRRGMSEAGILAALAAENARFAEPLEPAEVTKIAHSVARYEPTASAADAASEPQTFALTDVGNAERLVARHGEDLRYCEPLGGWLVWSGAHWQRDQTGEVTRRAIETVRTLYGEAAAATNPDRAQALAKWAIKSEAAPRIEAMLKLGRDLAGVAAAAETFDRHAWLLAVANGALDLRTGELRESRRADFCTRYVGVAYDAAAECPVWLAFLERILGGKAELLTFLQRAIGYSLTGDTRERVFFLLHGSGRNGKSTLLETLGRLLGSYARTAEASTFLERNQERVSNDLAMLAGARFVAVSEGHSGQRLHETLIKRVTGRDSITARFLFRENFTFEPQFKLWLATNHKPEVRDAGDAMWGRIRLVPFTVQIPEHEQDKGLPAKLADELPGILRWAVAGCLDWQRSGLTPPAEVLAATEAYRDEMDALGPFLDAQCVADGQAFVAAHDLYRAYTSWCENAREKPWSPKVFGTRLAERGFRSHRGSGGRRSWIGVRLRMADEAAAASESDASAAKMAVSDSSRVRPLIEKVYEKSDLASLASLAGVNDKATESENAADRPDERQETTASCWRDGCSEPVAARSVADGDWCAVHRERGVLLNAARAKGYPVIDLGGGVQLESGEWDAFVRGGSETEIGFVWDELGIGEQGL